jgi:parallel beta-helix repeat protein
MLKEAAFAVISMPNGKSSIVSVAMMLACALVVPLLSAPVGAANLNWNTDKLVSGAESYNGDVITLTANLTITGSLTLTNVDLKVNTPANGTYTILVDDGGSLTVLAKSKLHSTSAENHFRFQVRSNGTLTMNNSELHDCGWDDIDNYTQNPNSDRGLYIESNSVFITNCTITHNCVGVIVDSTSSPFIQSNNISDNDASGVEVYSSSTPTIDSNLVSGNLQMGIGWPSGGITSSGASPTITNNVVKANLDMYQQWQHNGIYLSGGSPTVVCNNITKQKDPNQWGAGVGIYIEGSNANIFRNNISDNDNGMYLFGGTCAIENNLIELSNDQWTGTGVQDSSSSAFKNNTYSKNRAGVYLYDGSSSTFDNDTMTGNTMAGVTGDAWGAQFTNTMTNCTFKGNMQDVLFNSQWGTGGTLTFITTTYNPNLVSISDPQSTLTVKWYMRAQVLYENGSKPINGAEVNFTDAGNKDVASIPTDAAGWTESQLLEEYSNTGGVKKSKSPYKVTAKMGFRINSTENVKLNESKTVTVIIDDIDPFVRFTSPPDGTLTNRTSILVNGKAEVGATLQLNGAQVLASGDGSWSVNMPLDNEGQNTFLAEVWDRALNKATASITVYKDTIAPALELTSPKDGFLTNKSTVVVMGTTSDPAANTTINGIPIPVDTDGKFSVLWNLTEGMNTIDVMSKDPANNWARLSRKGERDSTPPELVVAEPKNGYATNASAISVRGTIETGAIFTINNRTVTVSGNGFVANLDIVEGDNYFYFAARDKAGNVNTSWLWVVKDSFAPSLAISSPADNSKINRSTVDVKGRTDADATIKVNGEKVEFTGTNFCTTLAMNEGKNTITVEAFDRLGNRVATVLNVNVDTIAPELRLLSPLNNSLTNKNSIEVKGKTEPGANVKVGGTKATVDATGAFSAQVQLDIEGKNLIIATAWDAYFNTAESRITINRDTIVYFNVTSPAEGTKVKTKNITIWGDIETGGKVKLGTLDVNIAAYGTFSTEVLLVMGANTFNLTFTDPAGNEMTYSVNVTRIKPSTPPVSKGFIPGFEFVLVLAGTAVAALAVSSSRKRRK